MSTEPRLTRKQQRFIEEYLIDLNGAQAAIRAGYSEKTAKSTAMENLTKPYLKAVLDERIATRSIRLGISSEKVISDLVSIKNQAMQLVPDKNGRLVMADRAAALKALELLGRHLSA